MAEERHCQSGKCCDRCPKGTHVIAECNSTHPTQCERCKHNEYVADWNFLPRCRQCRPCHSSNNMRTAVECQAEQNRQCECVSGYYFIEKDNEHCAPVTECNPGSGVKVHATTGNDTVCAPCPPGTFSPKKGLSPCTPHTSCVKLGRELKSTGTDTTDAVCGPFIPRCSWMLPASLWAGLVMTLIFIVLFCVIYRWMKHKGNHTAVSGLCSLTVEPVGTTDPSYPCPELGTTGPSYPCLELGEHCQESCGGEKSLKSFLINPGNSLLLSPHHHHGNTENHGPSKTPLMDRSGQSVNGTNRHSLVRIPSEPQEDEWRGT